MIITSIKKQQKNPDRVSIYIDGRYGFSLHLNELLQYKLKNGQEIEEKDIKIYQKISEDGKRKMSALNWLLIRPRSEKEFSQYLMRKKIEPDINSGWIEEFKRRNYLNDAKFAIWWANSRRQNKNFSSKKIKLELIQKGIKNEYIENALLGLQEDETKALEEIIAKKSKLSRYKNDKAKLIKYLMGQGFRYSDIINALEFPVET